jgi:glycine/D-amino acid oxidase-like deaminating enzyme
LETVDVLIVGGGIAGCAMAWQCRVQGLRTLVIDDPRPDSASRVAAGLVTPVTGSRFAVSWRWPEFFPAADTLYQRVEKESGQSFWSVTPAWRAFVSQDEAKLCEQKCKNARSQFDDAMVHLDPIDVDAITQAQLPTSLATHGGIQMAPAARLDVPRYLDATRRVLQSEELFVSAYLDIDRDLQPSSDQVVVASLGLTARWAVLCQGNLARTNGWFSDLPLHPARGDILMIRSRSVQLDRVLHHQGWIVPLGEKRFLLGATYDRHALSTDGHDDAARRWREELCMRWTAMTGEKFEPDGAEILEHRIAVRPASYDRHPLIGAHPRSPNIWCLNGLGSKGSLMAPLLAMKLIDAMTDGRAIDPSLLWDRRPKGS